MQYLRKPIWRRYAPFAILILLDGWLLFGFSIVEGYPSTPADTSFLIPLILTLCISAWFFSKRPGIFLLQDAKPDETSLIQDKENGQRGLLILLKTLAGLTFFAAAFLWMMLMYRLDGFYITPDTYSYVRVAEIPVTSTSFWIGERPITLPILLKVFHINLATLNDPSFVVSSRAKLFTQFQALFSLASFSLLAVAVSSHIQSRFLRSIAATLTVTFAMLIDVAQWNRMLLSESVSLSLSALVISLWLLALHTFRVWHRIAPGLRGLLITFLIIVMAFFSLARDVHAYMLAMISGVLMIAMAVPYVRKHPTAPALITIALATGCVAALQISSQNLGERWLYPLTNIISKRVLTDSDAREFFLENGAPFDEIPDELLPVSCTEDCSNMHFFLQTNPYGQVLLEWTREEGKDVYLRYLLRQPLLILQRPFTNIVSLLSPDSTEYRQRQYADPMWLPLIRKILVPSSPDLILLWSVSALVISIIMVGFSSQQEHLLLPISMIIFSYLLMLVIWHGDAIELERHATQVSLQIKLALWYSTIFILDKCWGGRKSLLRA